jgi:hypothetical protein
MRKSCAFFRERIEGEKKGVYTYRRRGGTGQPRGGHGQQQERQQGPEQGRPGAGAGARVRFQRMGVSLVFIGV